MILKQKMIISEKLILYLVLKKIIKNFKFRFDHSKIAVTEKIQYFYNERKKVLIFYH